MSIHWAPVLTVSNSSYLMDRLSFRVFLLAISFCYWVCLSFFFSVDPRSFLSPLPRDSHEIQNSAESPHKKHNMDGINDSTGVDASTVVDAIHDIVNSIDKQIVRRLHKGCQNYGTLTRASSIGSKNGAGLIRLWIWPRELSTLHRDATTQCSISHIAWKWIEREGVTF